MTDRTDARPPGTLQARGPLSHPVFLIALCLLVLNDHLLKGANVLPTWCTGKLSDFAGLIVLPVLLSQLPMLQGKRGRAMVCAGVGVAFAAINLWPAASVALESATAWVGIPWRLWPDPTDLIALPTLGVAFHLARWRGPRRALTPPARLVAAVAAIACIATSPKDDLRGVEPGNGPVGTGGSLTYPGTGGLPGDGRHPDLPTSPWTPCEPRTVPSAHDEDAGAPDQDAGAEESFVTLCTDFIAVATGSSQVCGLRSDGSITCWDGYGREQAMGPNQDAAADFTLVTVGLHHTCALRRGGAVVCWGGDIEGEVSGPNADGAQDYVDLAAGAYHTCGLHADGSVTCWGFDDHGQVSDHSADGPAAFTQLAVGAYHSCALRDDGSAACWGKDDRGQVRGPSADGSTDYVGLAAGDRHTCALHADGSATCWGDEASWKTGEASPAGGPSFTQIVAGESHTCALDTLGSLHCWGGGPDTADLESGADLLQVAAGGSRTCGLRTDGSLVCWGDRL